MCLGHEFDLPCQSSSPHARAQYGARLQSCVRTLRVIAPNTVLTCAMNPPRVLAAEIQLICPRVMNAPSTLQRVNSQSIVVGRTLRQAHACRTLLRRLSKHMQTQTWRCEWLHNTERRLHIVTKSNRADRSWWVQKRRPDRWSQQFKLRGVKTRHGSRKGVLRYVPHLQIDGFIVLHWADGCWQPYDDARAKGSVDRTPQSTQGRAHAHGTLLWWHSKHTGMETRQ